MTRSDENAPVLHFEFNPPSAGWLNQLQSRARDSSSSAVRERAMAWKDLGLGELALAIATRLEVATSVEKIFWHNLEQLKQEVAESMKLDMHLARELAYRPSNPELLFAICAGIDGCLFEWRSLYEVVGKFVRQYAQGILDIPVTKSELVLAVESKGVPTEWIDLLQKNRNLFAHQTAPWFVFQILQRNPLQCELVAMKENLQTLRDPKKFISESQLRQAGQGLRESITAVRDWLLSELDRIETKNPA